MHHCSCLGSHAVWRCRWCGGCHCCCRCTWVQPLPVQPVIYQPVVYVQPKPVRPWLRPISLVR